MGRRLVAVLLAVLVASDFAERRRLVNQSSGPAASRPAASRVVLHPRGISSVGSDDEIDRAPFPPRSRTRDRRIMPNTANVLALANKAYAVERMNQLRAEALADKQMQERAEQSGLSEQSGEPCSSHSSTASGCDRWKSLWTSSMFPKRLDLQRLHLRFIMVFKVSVSDCKKDADEAKKAYEATDRRDFEKGWDEQTETSDLDDIIDVANGFQQPEPTEQQIRQDDWVALVQRQDTSGIVAYFRGNTPDLIGPYIARVESNSKHHIAGATSWGLSMLLHRLRLRGVARIELTDASGDYFDGMVEDRNSNTLVTKGSFVYGSMMKPKRPYTFETAKDNDTYSFNLNSERYGAEYGEGEPC